MSDPWFPHEQNPAKVEFAFGADVETPSWSWDWVDPHEGIKSSEDTALLDQSIRIQRGRSDWSSSASPSTASVTFWNPKGHLTPNNPDSPHFPHIKRGVPMRISVESNETFLSMPRDTQTPLGAWTAASPLWTALRDRGWFKVEFTPHVDTSTIDRQWIAGQWNLASGNAGWFIQYNAATDQIIFSWTTDGTVNSYQSRSFDVGSAGPGARMTVAFIFDSVGGTISFFYGETWDSLTYRGSEQIPTTPIYDTNAPLELGLTSSDTPSHAAPQKIWRFELRDWTSTGKVLAEVDITELEPGTTSWATYPGQETVITTATYGEDPGSYGFNSTYGGRIETTVGPVQIWNIQGDGVEITNREIRFFGDAMAWDVQWPQGDLESEGFTGVSLVKVTGLGVMSALSRDDPLRSAMFRYMTQNYDESSPAAYWPLEEPFGYTEILRNNTNPAANHSYWEFSGEPFDGSDSLLNGPLSYNEDRTAYFFAANLSPLAAGQTKWTATIFARVPQDGWVAIDQGESLGTVRLLSVRILHGPPGVSAATNVSIAFDKANGLYMYADNESIGPIWSAPRRFPASGYRALPAQWMQFSLHFDSNYFGDSIIWGTMRSLETGGQWVVSEPLNLQGITVGRVGNQTWTTGPGNVSVPGNVRFGHMMLRYGEESFWADDLYEPSEGYSGESPRDRFVRLCREEEIPSTYYADTLSDQPMGPQRPEEFLNLLEETRKVSNGIIGESWDDNGLVLRPAGSMREQSSRLHLRGKVAPNELQSPYSSILDDQLYTNRVTVDSETGGTWTEPQHGPARPVYPTSETVNVFSDSQLQAQALWRLTLGTWEDLRSPEVSVNLIESPHLISTVLAIREGDLISLSLLPSQHARPVAGTENVYLLVEGIIENQGPGVWEVTFSCTPGEPWRRGTDVPFPL